MAFHNLLMEMKRRMLHTNKRSVLIVIQHSNESDTYPKVPNVRESITNIIGFVALGDARYVEYIVKESVGVVDTIMADIDFKRNNSIELRESIREWAKYYNIEYSSYSDYESWALSALTFMVEYESMCGGCFFNNSHLIIGKSSLTTKIVLEIVGRGGDVYLLKEEFDTLEFPVCGGKIVLDASSVHLVSLADCNRFTALLGCALEQNNPNLYGLSKCRFDYIYDVGIGNFSESFIVLQRQKGADVLRSDDRAGISSIAINMRETRELVSHYLGRAEIGGIHVVSGGFVGSKGDIVVDNYNDPQKVLGVAKGDGTFKRVLDEQDKLNIQRIQKLL